MKTHWKKKFNYKYMGTYSLPEAKGHGLGNQIEGDYAAGMKTVIIEDLISTGGSSLAAYKALQAAGLEILGMLAIFTYGFPVSENNFKMAGCRLGTLSNYGSLLSLALQTGDILPEQENLLQQWREDPSTWGR